jgi:hypothetical protein
VYQSLQRSTGTANESFVIGGTGGDERNELRGSNPGALIPGHNYLMQLGFDIKAIPDADDGATAHGEVLFQVGGPSGQVPLSSAWSLVLLSLGSLFAATSIYLAWRGVRHSSSKTRRYRLGVR